MCVCIFILQIINEISQYERVNALTSKPHGFRSVSGTPALFQQAGIESS